MDAIGMKKEKKTAEKYMPPIVIAAFLGGMCGVLESATIMHLNPLAQSTVEKLFFFFICKQFMF